MSNKNAPNSNPVQHGVPALTSTSSAASASKGKQRKSTTESSNKSTSATDPAVRDPGEVGPQNPFEIVKVEPNAVLDNAPLNQEEAQDLKRCETIIEENAENVRAFEEAFSEIKEKRLYKADYSSFKEYCEKRWNFSRAQGYRLINEQKIKKVSQIGDTLNASQLRVLSNLTQDQAKMVCEQARENLNSAPMTAKALENAKQELFPEKAAAKPTKANDADKKPETEQASPPEVTPIPLHGNPTPAKFITAAEYHKRSDMPDLSQLSDMLLKLKNIGWDNNKKTERDKLFLALSAWLPYYAKWEQEIVFGGLKQEAA